MEVNIGRPIHVIIHQLFEMCSHSCKKCLLAVISICLCVSVQLPQNRFPQNLMLENFMNLSRKSKFRYKWVLYMKTQVHVLLLVTFRWSLRVKLSCTVLTVHEETPPHTHTPMLHVHC